MASATEIKVSDFAVEMEVNVNEILGLVAAQKILTASIDEKMVGLLDAAANLQRALADAQQPTQ